MMMIIMVIMVIYTQYIHIYICTAKLASIYTTCIIRYCHVTLYVYTSVGHYRNKYNIQLTI